MEKPIKFGIMAIYVVMIVMLSSSCAKFKQIQKDKYASVEHHYHDSTSYYEKETIKEVYLDPDSTQAFFDLERFLEDGYAKSTDRYFTTEIRYVDNGIAVTTSVDSLMQVIREIQREQLRVTSKKEDEVNTTSSEKKVTTVNIWPLVIGLIGLVILFFVLRFLYKKFKNPIGF